MNNEIITKTYRLKYWYLATGMEGIPDEYPEKVIEATSRDEAFYKYHLSNGVDFGSFEEFMEKEKYVREWGTVCKEINDNQFKLNDCKTFMFIDESTCSCDNCDVVKKCARLYTLSKHVLVICKDCLQDIINQFE